MQRLLLNRAVWDTFAAMGVVRRFAVAGLEGQDGGGVQAGLPKPPPSTRFWLA